MMEVWGRFFLSLVGFCPLEGSGGEGAHAEKVSLSLLLFLSGRGFLFMVLHSN